MINILVVEDDEKLHHIACAYLAEQGYKAIGCLSAVEAFDRMIDNIIGLIISDIMMPEVDGFKFASIFSALISGSARLLSMTDWAGVLTHDTEERIGPGSGVLFGNL
jgi:DNA-binding response OmpR family regulator